MNFCRLKVAFAGLALALQLMAPAKAIDNTSNIPVLLYHSTQVPPAGFSCNYSNTAAYALEQDLQTLHQQGFTVVPLYWITQWALSQRDASELPSRLVGLAFDDGANYDWEDWTHPTCGQIKSFRRILQEFKVSTPSLPWYSPHAANFVLASPAARASILAGNNAAGMLPFPLDDYWWGAANQSGIMEIYNHGMDHDHFRIQSALYDGAIGVSVPVNGAPGQNDFYRTDTGYEAYVQVVTAGSYIAGKIGAFPDLFAYPLGQGQPGSYLFSWFNDYPTTHNTYAAYCLGDTYVSRASPRYCLPRFSYLSGWGTSSGLLQILSNSGQYQFPSSY